MLKYGRSLHVVRGISGTIQSSAAMHVPQSRHSNSWSFGITVRIGGWALHLGAVNVAFVCVTFIHVAAVVIIVALTASLPFRILIPI